MRKIIKIIFSFKLISWKIYIFKKFYTNSFCFKIYKIWYSVITHNFYFLYFINKSFFKTCSTNKKVKEIEK